jgi:hypothetical protein
MAQSQPAVVQDEPVTGVIAVSKDYPALTNMLTIMKMEAASNEGNPTDEFVMDLMEQILSAESPEAVFAAQETGMVSGKDFANRPFYLTSGGISYQRSTIEGGSGLPFYALLRVTTIDTGEEVTLNCGGKTFLACLHALNRLDYFQASKEFPNGRAVVILSKPSPAGAYLLLAPFNLAAVSRGKKSA